MHSTRTDDEPTSVLNVPNPAIGDLVAAVDDKKLPVSERNKAYEDAMAFFLDDENDVDNIPLEEDVDVLRMVDGVEKKIMTIRLRTIDDVELKSTRSRSKEVGQKGVRSDEQETDEIRFYTLLTALAMVKPAFNEQLQAKFISPENMLRSRLLPGERYALGLFVMDRSGFGRSVKSATSDEIEAAKN